MSDTFEYRTPPIQEVALSVSTVGPALLDPYDVAATHDLFRSGFPTVERAGTFSGLEPFPDDGTPVPPIPPFFFQQESGIPLSRWWFSSEKSHDLIQVQENFFARNWRRGALPPDHSGNYPGFDALHADFHAKLGVLHERQLQQGSGELAQPVVAELLYDNLIPLAPEGNKLRMRDVLRPLRFEGEKSRSGFQMSWLESIDSPEEIQSLKMHVNAAALGMAVVGTPARPFLKLTFTTRAVVQDNKHLGVFFELAHERAREQLTFLTTDDIRATW